MCFSLLDHGMIPRSKERIAWICRTARPGLKTEKLDGMNRPFPVAETRPDVSKTTPERQEGAREGERSH